MLRFLRNLFSFLHPYFPLCFSSFTSSFAHSFIHSFLYRTWRSWALPLSKRESSSGFNQGFSE